MRPGLLLRAALALALGAPALATWSIVVVDLSTREVCSATATCIEGYGLEELVPLVVVGKGAGAAQAFVLSNAENRKKMFNGFKNGKEPWEILRKIAGADGDLDKRQFGIVGVLGDPLSFTGAHLVLNSAHHWAGGRSGAQGDLVYAIQGNVLAGEAVVLAAEQALLSTEGDLSQKVMAAMMAARRYGGDGRCSCHPTKADSCGSPPPDFDKSAHQAVLVLARPGDVDGTCTGSEGCVTGEYYLKVLVGGTWADPDPVDVLQLEVDAWRAALAGVPDHYLSEVLVDAQSLVADARSSATVLVRLADVDGVPLAHGGASLSVAFAGEGRPTALPGPVEDLGDGRYRFELVATSSPGRGSWVIDVDHGGRRPVRLWPPLVLQTDPLVELHAGVYDFFLGEDAAVPFTLNRAPSEAGRPYQLLGSAAGTEPGIPWGGTTIPLNRDRLFELTWTKPNGPAFHGSAGLLDAEGRAEAWLRFPAAGWAAFAGERLHFVGLLGGPTVELTNLATFRVLP